MKSPNTSSNPAFTSSVIILEAKPEHVDDLVNKVFEDAGVQTASVGGLRMSPHIYNNADHVGRVIEAVKKNRAMLA